MKIRSAKIYNFEVYAGDLIELEIGKYYKFIYHENYKGPPVSLTLPVSKKEYDFNNFPPFFEGLLPEGFLLDALLRLTKTDRNDFFSQLLIVGKDLVGSVTVEEAQ